MNRYGPTVLRLVVGATFAAHGAQKLFGVWNGGGLPATAAMIGSLGLSPAWPLAIVLGVVEFVGGLMLIGGAYTLWASLALLVDMVVAIWKVHLPHGYFLAQGGMEYNVVLVGALLALVLTGAGALSVDGRRARSAEIQAAGRARLRAGKV
ncbi:MAG TPA: DoxX family protein [Vicinamibacterales bacterium]|nr:DoxX family protein [Vicinamibacterales bacterium]